MAKLKHLLGRTPSGRSMNASPKVFFIGFNKTGTRALSYLFGKHGYPVVHGDSKLLTLRMISNLESGLPILAGYDGKYKVFSDMIAVTDSTWVEGNSLFKILDQQYPGSYFIYNTRNMENWLRSRELHGGGKLMQTQMRLLGSTDPQDVINYWRRQRHDFEKEIGDYFSQRSDQFLVLDIDHDDVVLAISAFIGEPLRRRHWLQLGKTT